MLRVRIIALPLHMEGMQPAYELFPANKLAKVMKMFNILDFKKIERFGIKVVIRELEVGTIIYQTKGYDDNLCTTLKS